MHGVGVRGMAGRGDVDLEVAEDDDTAVERQRATTAADAAGIVGEELQVAEALQQDGDDPLT